jgi:hypothetical protein
LRRSVEAAGSSWVEGMVEYFEYRELPGQAFFACQRLRARLSVDACRSNWMRGHVERHEDRVSCKGCPIGAAHAAGAGVELTSTSPYRGMRICARCHRYAARLIGGYACVSCRKREYEAIKGRNAKGTRPVKIAGRLARRRLRFLAADQVQELDVERSIDTAELVMAVLRDCLHQVGFVYTPFPCDGRRDDA